MRSPLRYPGGKSRAVKYITQIIPHDVNLLVSPFFGGGSIELACAANGITVKGFDIFRPLVAFWRYLLTNPTELADQVQDYFPLTKSQFYQLQSQHQDIDTPEQAVLFYVLNRASFSGTTLCGGCSEQSVTGRFTQSSIDRLREFTSANLTVDYADFSDVLDEYSDEFMYLDPPYPIKSRLYGNRGSAHKGFDHQGLAKQLQTCKRWILSYNNCPEILELYQGYTMLHPQWQYGMSQAKNSKEILIVKL